MTVKFRGHDRRKRYSRVTRIAPFCVPNLSTDSSEPFTYFANTLHIALTRSDIRHSSLISFGFLFRYIFSNLDEWKTCGRGGLKILQFQTSTHLQIDIRPSVMRMSPMETRHARKDRRHNHAITIVYGHVSIPITFPTGNAGSR